MSDYQHVGYVYYNSHPASPLVVGDFQVMKGWKGNPDGNDDNEVIDIGTGRIFTGDLDLNAPDVFRRGDEEVVLMAEDRKRNLLESYTLEELQTPLGAAIEEPVGTFEIEVPSGAIVVSIAYNATPEEGADTSHLDELNWHDDLPYLPKVAPIAPYYHAVDDENHDWRGHCIVPVKAGTYSVVVGDVEGGDNGFMKIVLRHKGAA